MSKNFLNWRQVDSDRPIVFVHIPRTAGTSFRRAVESKYGTDQVGLIHHGYYTEDEAIKKQSQFKILTGHFGMGAALLNSLSGPVNLVTILREPLSRFLSFYHYGIHMDSYIEHETIKNQKLDDLILDPNYAQHNAMCHILSGIDDKDFIDLAYRKSCDNLEHSFSFFGLTENYPEFLAIVCRRFGWGHITVRQEEYVSGLLRPEELNPDLLQTLKIHNEADINLYEFALSLYEKRRLHWLR
jgi:hypothetical protein